MASSVINQRKRYPLMAYNFRVDVGSVTMRFSEVTGLKREYDHVTYRHGLSYAEGEDITTYRIDKYAAITMKRGTVQAQNQLQDWLDARSTKSMDIHLCDDQGNQVVTWHVGKAVAVKFEAPTFSATSGEVAVETLEVMAAGVKVQHKEFDEPTQ